MAHKRKCFAPNLSQKDSYFPKKMLCIFYLCCQGQENGSLFQKHIRLGLLKIQGNVFKMLDSRFATSILSVCPSVTLEMNKGLH